MPAAFYEFSGEQGADFVTSFKILKPGGGLFKFIPAAARSITTEVPNGEIGCAPSSPIPGLTQRIWEKGSGTTQDSLNIDIPEEIKLAYPNITDAFGWLKASTTTETNSAINKSFLTIRCQIRNSKNCVMLSGATTYKAVSIPCPTDTSNYKIGLSVSHNSGITRESLNTGGVTGNATGCAAIAAGTGLIIFDLINSSPEYNIVMKIPSCNNSSGCSPRTSTATPPTGTLDFQGKFLYDIELEYNIGSSPSATLKPYVIRLLQGRFTFNPNITR